MSAQPSYLIIGAGVFGVSTAYHLIKKYPNAHIQLVDRTQYPCPLAASWDWNKVIRADYGDIFYMKLAFEAIQYWRHDPLFSQFYHQSGLINIDNTELGKKILKNYEKLGIEVDAEVRSPERFKAMYGSFYDHTDQIHPSILMLTSPRGGDATNSAIVGPGPIHRQVLQRRGL